MDLDLVERTLEPCRNALEAARLEPEQINEVILVGGMTRMPAVQNRVKNIFGKEPHKGVNPDEVVALGAAIQGGVLKGDVKDVLLLDVTPLSLGIETLGGVTTQLIAKNTTIPAKNSQVFSTAEDNQSAVSIHVLQGEREMAVGNKSLGRFELTGIAAAPRGIPQIEVTFDIDANGIMHVTAKDKATGKENKIVIKSSSGLSDDEIDKMVRDAEEHADEDRKAKELVDARNQGDAMLHSVRKSLTDLADKVEASDKENIEKAAAELEEALKGDDKADIEAKTEALATASHKLAEQAYADAGGADAGAAGAESAGAEQPEAAAGDDVVDAEFEEIKDDKK